MYIHPEIGRRLAEAKSKELLGNPVVRRRVLDANIEQPQGGSGDRSSCNARPSGAIAAGPGRRLVRRVINGVHVS